jgi:chorismate mutase/prephenate dehydratase
VEHDPLDRIGSVFTEVRHGHIDYGLVPIENSIFGGITETLDEFLVSKGEVTIYAEVQIEVHHTLLSHCEAPRIKRIHSKPEVFGQCRNWLMQQFPHAELVPEASSSKAAQLVADKYAAEGDACASAAIGSTLAGQIYGVPVLFERVEDNPNTITRFFVISRQQAAPSGDDKTSIMFITADRHGALVEVLAAFDRAGVNLSHIEKRPSGRTNWHYTFFIDALGHREDDAMRSALKEASEHCQELTVLGSFPRATRIL